MDQEGLSMLLFDQSGFLRTLKILIVGQVKLFSMLRINWALFEYK